MEKIVLASNSATRAEILQKANIPFIQRSSDFDEEGIDIKSPSSFVYHATIGKTKAYIQKFGLDIPVVCADTVVTSKGMLLRKAKNKAQAKEILLAQSGSKVSILTCMTYTSKSIQVIDLSSTEYFFKEFDMESLEAYLQTDEWKGKAGACMVEGFCKKYIKEVKGFESTAMGLCVEKLLPHLKGQDV